MTVLAGDPTPLAQVLKDPTLTLLLLDGTPGGVAEALDTAIGKKVTEGWRKSFLITQRGILPPALAALLVKNGYLVLGGATPKQAADQGPLSDLLMPDQTTPAWISILKAFAAGDALAPNDGGTGV
jgi:hypothetical protein